MATKPSSRTMTSPQSAEEANRQAFVRTGVPADTRVGDVGHGRREQGQPGSDEPGGSIRVSRGQGAEQDGTDEAAGEVSGLDETGRRARGLRVEPDDREEEHADPSPAHRER